MPIKKNLVVHNGSWTDKENNTHNDWVTIGALHEGRDGKDDYLILHAHINLAGLAREQGENRIFARMYDPKPKDSGFDDDINF